MIRDLIEKMETVRMRIETVPEVVEWMVHDHSDELVSLNRDQMLLGRDAEGNVLSPDYLSDPYFKTKAQAEAYANMKYRLEGVHRARIVHPLNWPDKDKNTPNLIVTGPFQDSMFVTTNADSFTIGAAYADSPDIERKYAGKVFGLAPLSREYFYEQYIKPAVRRHLKLTR